MFPKIVVRDKDAELADALGWAFFLVIFSLLLFFSPVSSSKAPNAESQMKDLARLRSASAAARLVASAAPSVASSANSIRSPKCSPSSKTIPSGLAPVRKAKRGELCFLLDDNFFNIPDQEWAKRPNYFVEGQRPYRSSSDEQSGSCPKANFDSQGSEVSSKIEEHAAQ